MNTELLKELLFKAGAGFVGAVSLATLHGYHKTIYKNESSIKSFGIVKLIVARTRYLNFPQVPRTVRELIRTAPITWCDPTMWTDINSALT